MEEDYQGSKRIAPAGQWKTPTGNMWSSTPMDDQDQINPFLTSSFPGHAAVPTTTTTTEKQTVSTSNSGQHHKQDNLSSGLSGNGEISPDQLFYANVLNTHNSNDFLADLGGYILSSPSSSSSSAPVGTIPPTLINSSTVALSSQSIGLPTGSINTTQRSTMLVTGSNSGSPSTGNGVIVSSSSSSSSSVSSKKNNTDNNSNNSFFNIDYNETFNTTDNTVRSMRSTTYTNSLPDIHRLTIDPIIDPNRVSTGYYNPPSNKNIHSSSSSLSTSVIDTLSLCSSNSITNPAPLLKTTNVSSHPSSPSVPTTVGNKSLSSIHIAPSVTVPGLLNTIYPYTNIQNPLPQIVRVKPYPTLPVTIPMDSQTTNNTSTLLQTVNLRCIGAIISRISIKDTDTVEMTEETNTHGFKQVGVHVLTTNNNNNNINNQRTGLSGSNNSSPKHTAVRNTPTTNLASSASTSGNFSSSPNLLGLGSTTETTTPGTGTLRKSNSRARLNGPIPGSPLARSISSNSIHDNNGNTTNRASPLLLGSNGLSLLQPLQLSSSSSSSPKLKPSGNSSGNLQNQPQPQQSSASSIHSSSSATNVSRSNTLKRKSSSNMVVGGGGGSYGGTSNGTSPLLQSSSSTLTSSNAQENLVVSLPHPRNNVMDPLQLLLSKTIPTQLQLATLPVAVENLEFGLGFDEEGDTNGKLPTTDATTTGFSLSSSSSAASVAVDHSLMMTENTSNNTYSSLARNQRTNSSKRLGIDGSSPILTSYNPSTNSPKFGPINTLGGSSMNTTATTTNSTRSPASNSMILGVTTNIAVLDPVLAVALAQQQQQNNTLNLQTGRLTTGFRRSRTDLSRLTTDNNNNDGASDGTSTPRGDYGTLTPTMNGGNSNSNNNNEIIKTSRSGRAIIKPGSNSTSNSNHNSPVITGGEGGFPRIPSNLNLTASATGSYHSSPSITTASMVRSGSKTSLPTMIANLNNNNNSTTTGFVAPKGFTTGNGTGGYGTGGIALNDFIFGLDDDDANENGTTGDRRNRRLERNRESARVRRKKKRDRVELLEKEIAGLAVQLDRLHSHRWGLWREPACLPLTRVGPGSIAMERAFYSNHRNNPSNNLSSSGNSSVRGGAASVISSSGNSGSSTTLSETNPLSNSSSLGDNGVTNKSLRRSLGIIHSGEVSEHSSRSQSPSRSSMMHGNNGITRVKTEGGIQIRATLLPLDDNGDGNDELMDTESSNTSTNMVGTENPSLPSLPSSLPTSTRGLTVPTLSTTSTIPVFSAVGNAGSSSISTMNSTVPTTTTTTTNSFGVAGTIPRGRNVRGALGMGLGLIPSTNNTNTTLPNPGNIILANDMLSVSGLSTLSAGSGPENISLAPGSTATASVNMITTSANLYAMESAPGSIRSSRSNRRTGRGRTGGDSYQFDDLLLMGGNPTKALHPTAVAARAKALHDANEVRDAWLAEVVGNPSGIAAISRPAPLPADTVCNRAVDLVSNVHNTLSRLRRDAAEVSLLISETQAIRTTHPEYLSGTDTLPSSMILPSTTGKGLGNKGTPTMMNNSLGLLGVPPMEDDSNLSNTTTSTNNNAFSSSSNGKMILKLTDTNLTKDMFDVLKLSPEQAIALSTLNGDIERTGYRMTKLDDFVTALLSPPSPSDNTSSTSSNSEPGGGLLNNGTMETDNTNNKNSSSISSSLPSTNPVEPLMNQYLRFKIVDMIRGPVVDLFNTDQIEGLLEWTDRNSDAIQKLTYPNYDPSEFDASGRLVTNIHIARARSMATNATINGNVQNHNNVHENGSGGGSNNNNTGGNRNSSSRTMKNLPKVSSSNSLSNLSTNNSPGALLTPGMITVLRQPTPNTNVTYNSNAMEQSNEDVSMNNNYPLPNTGNTISNGGSVIVRNSSGSNLPTVTHGGNTSTGSSSSSSSTGTSSIGRSKNSPGRFIAANNSTSPLLPNTSKSFMVSPNNTGTGNTLVPDKTLPFGNPPNLNNFSPSAVAAAATAMMSQLSPQLQAQFHAQLAMLTAQNKLQHSSSNPSLNTTGINPNSSSSNNNGNGGGKISTTHSSTGSITSQLSSTNLTDNTTDPQHLNSSNVNIGMSLSPAHGPISNNNHPGLHLNPLSLSMTTTTHPSPLLRLATNNTLHRSPSNLALGSAVLNNGNTSNNGNGTVLSTLQQQQHFRN